MEIILGTTMILNGLANEASIKDKIYITNSQGIIQIPTCTVTVNNGLSLIEVKPANNYTPDVYTLWVRDIELGDGTKIKNQVYLKVYSTVVRKVRLLRSKRRILRIYFRKEPFRLEYRAYASRFLFFISKLWLMFISTSEAEAASINLKWLANGTRKNTLSAVESSLVSFTRAQLLALMRTRITHLH